MKNLDVTSSIARLSTFYPAQVFWIPWLEAKKIGILVRILICTKLKMRFAKLESVVLALNIPLFYRAKIVCYELILSAGQVINFIITIAKMRNSVFHNSVFLLLYSHLHLFVRYSTANCMSLVACSAKVLIVESHHDANISDSLRCPGLNSVCICFRLNRKCVLRWCLNKRLNFGCA